MSFFSLRTHVSHIPPFLFSLFQQDPPPSFLKYFGRCVRQGWVSYSSVRQKPLLLVFLVLFLWFFLYTFSPFLLVSTASPLTPCTGFEFVAVRISYHTKFLALSLVSVHVVYSSSLTATYLLFSSLSLSCSLIVLPSLSQFPATQGSSAVPLGGVLCVHCWLTTQIVRFTAGKARAWASHIDGTTHICCGNVHVRESFILCWMYTHRLVAICAHPRIHRRVSVAQICVTAFSLVPGLVILSVQLSCLFSCTQWLMCWLALLKMFSLLFHFCQDSPHAICSLKDVEQFDYCCIFIVDLCSEDAAKYSVI